MKGPLRVVSHVGADYTLENLVDNRIHHVHVSKLRPFEYDQRFTDPRLIANKEQKAYDVEAILSHHGRKHDKQSLTFRVKWVGYDETECTYEPWANLRDNAILHRYLIHIGWKNFVPKKYQSQYRDAFPHVEEPILDDNAMDVVVDDDDQHEL